MRCAMRFTLIRLVSSGLEGRTYAAYPHIEETVCYTALTHSTHRGFA